MRAVLVSLLVVALAGCANGYQQFYKPYPGVTPEVLAKIRKGPPPQMPGVNYVATMDAAVFEAYGKKGYVPAGYSSFNSGQRQADSLAIEQGRAIGADLVVIVNPKYTGTVTTSIPITTPTISTSTYSGTTTVIGTKGTANAYGNGVITTYGSQTNYIPIAIHREDYGAVYFIKRQYSLGANFRDLNDSERNTLQTNKGIVITLIVDDTPAFNADILKGDIITSLNGEPITSVEALRVSLAAKVGQKITLSILRGSSKIEKVIQLQE
ncbi:PDZ domain-containing protein [Undibacterium squillarum]|uniref:PDZ domain-containing protein n=1 Tax=Undibacterium squillarum TaxID=1131567 RepID=A0ABQ2Y1B1_9BURK|nr:PDZ domain-containing protein [Undibacterium squillarum]GGX47322.1 hypothetical protein GCM10010946_27240 [Undibacterium squillarum]